MAIIRDQVREGVWTKVIIVETERDGKSKNIFTGRVKRILLEQKKEITDTMDLGG